MRHRAHLSLLAVVVVWAGSFSVIKALLDDGVEAFDIAIVRYAIAVPGFALILWRAGGLPGLTRRDATRIVVAGLLIVVGYHVSLNVGTRYTTSGIAALVVALAPGMTLLLAGLARARPDTDAAGRRPRRRVRRSRDRRRARGRGRRSRFAEREGAVDRRRSRRSRSPSTTSS